MVLPLVGGCMRHLPMFKKRAIAFGLPVKDFANSAGSDDPDLKRVVADGIGLLPTINWAKSRPSSRTAAGKNL